MNICSYIKHKKRNPQQTILLLALLMQQKRNRWRYSCGIKKDGVLQIDILYFPTVSRLMSKYPSGERRKKENNNLIAYADIIENAANCRKFRHPAYIFASTSS